MAYAIFEGFLVKIRNISSGFTFSLKEPTHNHLQKPIYHNLAAWGKIAQAMRPHMKAGTRFEVIAEISYNLKGQVKYTNFTVKSWKVITKPVIKPKTVQQPVDDDFFTPQVRREPTAEEKRYRDFPAA